MAKFCSTCGNQSFDNNVSFCVNCGATLSKTPSGMQSPPTPHLAVEQPTKPYMKILYMIFAIASGFLCILMAIATAALPPSPMKYVIVGIFALIAWYFYSNSKEMK